MSNNIIDINEQNFPTEVLQSNLPFLLDFSATWCGPCRAFTPILEEFATEHAGKVIVGKVDIDNSPKIAAEFNVRGVPTVIVFKEGLEVARQIGMSDKATLAKLMGL